MSRDFARNQKKGNKQMKNDKAAIGELRQIRYECGHVADVQGKVLYLLLTKKVGEETFEAYPVIEFQVELAQGDDLVSIKQHQGITLLIKPGIVFKILESSLGEFVEKLFESSRLGMRDFKKSLNSTPRSRKAPVQGYRFARELGAKEWRKLGPDEKLPDILTSIYWLKEESVGEAEWHKFQVEMEERKEAVKFEKEHGIR